MRPRLPDRLTFWRRRQPLDLSCISNEDWERLERASRGDERELTARIMLLAYLAKANGHSTYDAILPPDLTAEQANRLADQLIIGEQGGRVGAPGRRGQIRLLEGEAEQPTKSSTPPRIFGFFHAFAMVLVSLAVLLSPWAVAEAADTVLLVLAFSGAAAYLRRAVPNLGMAYAVVAAAFAEGVLRAALPVEVWLGAVPILVMALWTIMIQPAMRGGRLLRTFAWSAISLCALSVPIEWAGVSTYPLWAPLLGAAILVLTLKASKLGLWRHPLTIANLLPAMTTVIVLSAGLVLPISYGDAIVWVTNAALMLAPLCSSLHVWRHARSHESRVSSAWT